jgi:hypothetical protein
VPPVLTKASISFLPRDAEAFCFLEDMPWLRASTGAVQQDDELEYNHPAKLGVRVGIGIELAV